MRRLLILLLAFLAILSPSAPLLAGGREDLYAAMEAERVAGDLEGALHLYRRAANSEIAEIIPVARLGVGRCLRRLGRTEEARKTLEALTGTEVAAAARRELGKLEQTGEPAVPPEVVEPGELPAEERAREQEHRAALTKWYVSQARSAYRETRYEEAREWVRRALELQPTNREAREILLHLGDTPDDRGRLLREIFRLLDSERRLRLDDLMLRANALLSTGQAMLLQGDLDTAVERFVECIALLDANPSFDPDLASRRDNAVQFRDQAVLRGGSLPETMPEIPPDTTASDRWRDTLRALFLDLGSPRRPGDRLLRIYDLGGFAGSERGEPPTAGQLSISEDRPFPGPLIAELIPSVVGSQAFARGRHLLRAEGSDLILYAPEEIQNEVQHLLTRLGARQDPAARLSVIALAASSPSLARAASEAEAVFEPRGEGAFAVLDSDHLMRLLDVLTSREHAEVLGRLEVTVLPERTVGVEQSRTLNIQAPPNESGEPLFSRLRYGFQAAILPVWTKGGLGLSVSATATFPAEPLMLPAAPAGTFQVPSQARESVVAAGVIPPEGALAVAGLGNPFDQRSLAGRKSLLLLFVPSSTAVPAVSPETEDPFGGDPGAPGPVSVDLGDLAAGIGDEPAPPFRGGPPMPEESRTGFLLSWLAEAVGSDLTNRPGNTLTVSQGVVRIHGDADFAEQVKALIKGLTAQSDRLVTIRIRAARVSTGEESLLFRGLSTTGRVIRGQGVRVHVLRGDERRRVVYEIAGAEGRLSRLPRVADARSTQLVNVSRVTTSRYLRGTVAENGKRRPVYDLIDEGLAVELRPVALSGGVIDLSVGVRVARILDRGSAGAAPRESGPERPLQVISAAQVRAALSPEETLMITGLPAPTPTEGRRDRLVLLVETVKE
jgi:tetratricopeptide (TPR) repeat protein